MTHSLVNSRIVNYSLIVDGIRPRDLTQDRRLGREWFTFSGVDNSLDGLKSSFIMVNKCEITTGETFLYFTYVFLILL